MVDCGQDCVFHVCSMKTIMFCVPVTKECSHIEYGKQIAWSSVYGVSSALIHVNWFQRELFHFQFIVTKHAKNVVPKNVL